MSEKDKTESPPSPAPESRPRPAPEDTARWYQFITLPWAWGVVRAGAREPLTEFDLFDLGRGKSTAELADRLLADFEKREAVDLAWNASLKSLQPTIVRRARWLLLSAIGLCKPDGRRQRGLGHALFAVFGLCVRSSPLLLNVAVSTGGTAPASTPSGTSSASCSRSFPSGSSAGARKVPRSRFMAV